jgi:DNA-binding transcriptional LysR family regulator
MELRHLRYFVAVAEELHFRRAAERLHVAQPAVSEQIRKLEDELGVKLFNRTQRSVTMTESGAAMLDEARRVLRQAGVARQTARNARNHETSRLRVGYLAGFVPPVVPRALQGLVASMPDVEIQLETGHAHALLDDVRSGVLDAAVVSVPAPTAGLRTVEVGTQRPVVALRAGHELAVRSAIDLAQIAPERLVVLPREANRPFHDAVVALTREAGLSPTLVELPDADIERTLLAVASGSDLAVLPESVAERANGSGIRFLPLAGIEHATSTAVVTRSTTDHLPTVALLRSLNRAMKARAAVAPQPVPALVTAA